jgi:hypothetical protein
MGIEIRAIALDDSAIINKEFEKKGRMFSPFFYLSCFSCQPLRISRHLITWYLKWLLHVSYEKASNYGGGWTNGSKGGSDFWAWSFPTGANTGVFIGNPAKDGMGTKGIGTTAFDRHTAASSFQGLSHDLI